MCETFVPKEEYINVCHSKDMHDIKQNITINSSKTLEQILIS